MAVLKASVLFVLARATVQVRVPVAEVAQVVRKLVDSQLSWQEVAAKYPQQKAADDEQQQ
jgi:hypothetical protein